MATTRNIQMQYFNGTDYDTLYPQTQYSNIIGTPSLSFSNITGTVTTSQLPTIPINKGGTGQTSASAGLGALTYGASTTSSLSNSYYFAVASGSTTGRKVSMSTLGNYIKNNYSGGGDFLYGDMIRSTATGEDIDVVFPSHSGCRLMMVFIISESFWSGSRNWFWPCIRGQNSSSYTPQDGYLVYNPDRGNFAGRNAAYEFYSNNAITLKSGVWGNLTQGATVLVLYGISAPY